VLQSGNISLEKKDVEEGNMMFAKTVYRYVSLDSVLVDEEFLRKCRFYYYSSCSMQLQSVS
jgi:hypothetical protein